MQWDTVINLAIGVGTGVSILVLISLGLAVIFGMMGVINFAHGEFLMIGAFTTYSGYSIGIPLPLAMLVAALIAGLLGIVVEQVLVRRLYGRLESTMLATFGLSLVLVQVAVLIWGTSPAGIPTPLGVVSIGRYSVSMYRIVLIVAAVGLLALVWWVFVKTGFGLRARAAALDAETAASVGVNAARTNMWTFGLGGALAGAGGALLAPIVAVSANMGSVYIAQAFMTVVVGGPGVITGTVSAAGLLGTVQRAASDLFAPLIGIAALLVVALVLVRVLPNGISGRLRRDL